METGTIVGIVLGVVAFVLVIGYLVYTYYWLPNRNRLSHTVSEGESAINMNMRARKYLQSYSSDEKYNNDNDLRYGDDNDANDGDIHDDTDSKENKDPNIELTDEERKKWSDISMEEYYR